jgi:hypothetical protein
MAKNLIDIWFVTDPETQKVEQLLMLGPLGMSSREDGEWEYVGKEAVDLKDMTQKIIYDYDWSSDTEPLSDEFTEEDLIPQLAKFDSGELSVSDLKDVSYLLYDGTDQE